MLENNEVVEGQLSCARRREVVVWSEGFYYYQIYMNYATIPVIQESSLHFPENTEKIK